MKKITLFLICMIFGGISVLWAQNSQVSGVVTDAADGQAMPGVSIVVKGTNVNATTDMLGRYTIVAPNDAVLVFSFLGMKTREETVAGRTTINVALESDALALDEVVVTAMGISREKKALGYAVQDVKGDELQKAANTNLVTALQGKVAGVDIVSSSGMPGASSKITIRGARSFTGNNTPLYVVDGLPIASTSDFSTNNSVTGSDYANRSFDLDPNDIESINILKGQAASALYGMRASNGVIVITTKNGKGTGAGKVTVNVSSNVSFDKVSVLPDFQTTYAQGTLNNSGTPIYSPTASTSWGPKIEDLPNDPTYGGNTNNTYTAASGLKQGYYYVRQRALAGLDPWAQPQVYNNAKEYFDTGFTWNNSVSVSKGLENGHWSLSLGSANTTGIIPSTGSDRYNGKFAAELQLSEHWSGGFTGNFVNSSISKQTSANDGLVATIYAAPPSYDFKGIPPHIEGDPYSQNNYRNTSGFDSAYWAIDNNSFTEETQRFFGNAFINYALNFDNSKLNVKYQLGIDAYATNYEDLWGYGHANGKGEVDDYSVAKKELNSLLTATWNWKITDELVFDLLYGNEIIEYKRNFVETYGMNFNFSGWNHINNASVYQGSASQTGSRTFGNFGNVALAWRSQLYFNATVRNDLVSSMPAGSRSFTYPSVSLGWIFTEIETLKNDVLTFGKLRASYAEVGQAGNYTDTYYRTPTYGGGFSSGTPIMYPIQGVTAYTLNSTVYDPNLKPQNTRSYEMGADLDFFNGLFSVNYTFSRQNVKDQIFGVPLAGSTGAGQLVTNGGSIHTNSHELTLGVKPFDTRNFKWDFAFNFTKIDNYVDELAEGVESIFLGGFTEPQVRAGIGDKFPVIYGVSYQRNDKGEIVIGSDGFPQAGEEQVLGAVSPDFRLGFVTNFEIYKVYLSAVFDWKQGGVIYSATPGLLDFYGVTQKSADFREKTNFLFEDPAVKADGTPNDITISGADAYYYFNALNNISESMVTENSFIKLRELSLSYPVWNKNDFSITLNAFARNIILWSTIDGMDPEATQGNNNMAGSFERFSLPGTTSYGFGINLKF